MDEDPKEEMDKEDEYINEDFDVKAIEDTFIVFVYLYLDVMFILYFVMYYLVIYLVFIT